MRKPLENMQVFKRRRQQLANLMPGSVLIVGSLPESLRNGTVHNSFRQDSNLYYLTGFEEPGSIFVFRPGQSPESILFVRPKDPNMEIWDGFRFGPEAAQTQFGLDQVYSINSFEKEMPKLLKGANQLHYRLFRNRSLDERVEQALLDYKQSLGRTGLGLLPILDSDELLGQLRLFKSDEEIHNHRRACEITSLAHIEVMKKTKPGVNERELHGLFIHEVMKRGAAREGYGGIFASGANSCILHYVFNDQVLKAGDLLLVDAGGEYNYFTSDITRTYPVSGRMSPQQKLVYDGVLQVQKSIISSIRVGQPYKDLHDKAVDELTQVMLELGFLTGRKADLIESLEYKRFFPHGLGHFLGMDVHDLGLYTDRKNQGVLIAPGMVFTVEPGMYIQPNDTTVNLEFRGIGIRIEDDVLVTTNGYEVMTSQCPKEVSELESLIGKAT